MNPEERIAKYKAAYERANGSECTVTYSNGWYTFNRWHKFRGKKLEQLTSHLNWRADQREAEQ